MHNRSSVIADETVFYCSECGKRGMPLPRIRGKERNAGHLKKIWCLNCKKETNHVETKEWTHYQYSDFLLEFENNNFKDGKRVLEYGQFRQKMNKEGKI